MKRWRSVAGILAAVLIVLVVAKNVIAKTVVESGVRLITGLRLSMDGMDLGLLETSIGIRGLKLYNPPGFADPLMVSLPEIYVDYDPIALLSGGVHLEDMRLDLQEFTVERNAQGQLNLDSLAVVKESKRARQGQPAAATKPKTRLRIDVLDLRIGTVLYKDYSAGSPPRCRSSPSTFTSATSTSQTRMRWAG